MSDTTPTDAMVEAAVAAWKGPIDQWFTRREKLHDSRQWEVVHDLGGDVVDDETMAVVARFETSAEANTHAEKLESAARMKAALTAALQHYEPAATPPAPSALDRAVEALEGAKGYMLNAVIDLNTGTKKETTLSTLRGGIKTLDLALEAIRGNGGGT